eukprot:CAMPEP_0181457434 /NCGR_PEP_ID=MMETSP1110-20121109/31784_1 /TAXON_ID=174948 /ORGANISM="Symbiodinium sp., Strain CCMP421" /LENGTH=43 /DNA_ID= /DNA_START= /DNA_END= /DNA_ORIENTATION=
MPPRSAAADEDVFKPVTTVFDSPGRALGLALAAWVLALASSGL